MAASFSSYEGCAQTGQHSSEEPGHTAAGRGALRWKTLIDHSSCCRNLTPKSEDVSQGWGDAAVVFSSEARAITVSQTGLWGRRGVPGTRTEAAACSASAPTG